MGELICIYTLSDPDDGRVRYVGQTNKPKSRLAGHISEVGTSPKHCWIEELCSIGKFPIMEIICEIPSEYADKVESALIAAYCLACPDLLNVRKHKARTSQLKARAREAKPVWRDTRDAILTPDGIIWTKPAGRVK